MEGILNNMELIQKLFYEVTKTVGKGDMEKKILDIDGNTVQRGDYILYAHSRLGLIYARVIYATYYRVCIYPLHEDATKRKSYLWNDKFYLVVEDDVPEKIKSLAGTAKKAAEWWL